MATIEMLTLPAATRPAELWRSVAQATRGWLAERGLPAADAVLLLPFADLLAPARKALAESGGWLPRVHTPRTLAAALGPPVPHAAGEVTGDATIDRATARDLLRGQAWAAAWLQRDPRAFDAALHSLVRATHELRTAAISRPPHERAAWWAQARQQVAKGSGVGAMHRLLMRAAIEWCALDDGADTDRLFQHRPAAWIALTLGGEDALAQGALREAAAQGVPTLQLSADPASNDPFEQWPETCGFELEVADDAETEALASAWQVARLVRDGATPVALVAQDRALVRRVRAVLERLGIDVVDETGWSLTTTRAGAHAAAALRAALPGARADDLLDWLKADLGESMTGELALLEKLWRGGRISDQRQRARADALWSVERGRLEAFAQPRQRPLASWLHALDRLLYGAAHSAPWRDDAAAVQLRRALRLDPHGHGAWADSTPTPWSLEDFTAWVDAALEEATFVPPASEQAARVVVTPLSRAIGREFAVAVVPGADETRLAPAAPEPGLLDDHLRRALGLPERAARQRRAALSFLQLLRLPRVVALRRRADGDELLSASPWIERLRLARRQRSAVPLVAREVELPVREVMLRPTPRPLPRAAAALPDSLSASAVEALRQCPYRFFSRVALHLGEHEELDDDADKRDAGKWLHATLERFHAARKSRRDAAQDVDHFVRAGHDALADLAHGEGVQLQAMLPFSAGLPALAARYARWLHAEEALGWQFQAAELSIGPAPTGADGLRLHGLIDLIDRRVDAKAVRLIDYKTTSRKALEDKVRQPLEDTQLAVYAALHLAENEAVASIEACYVAIDDSDEVAAVAHAGVEDSARQLTHHVAAERARIEAGASLPALGEPPVCDTCEARGLCRRDHWSDAVVEAPGAA